MANENKICIIYWGLIRGFRFDYTFNSHKQYLYDNFKNNNIDFDVYLVTNNIEYNEINVDKIPNLKTLKIIDVDEIHNLEYYKNAYKNINFTTNGWSDYFHTNLLTVYCNKQQLINCIPGDYKKYISMDIGQIVNKFDISLVKSKHNFSSSFETSSVINPRILIGSYNCIYAEMNKFNEILTYNKTVHFLNPECFLVYYFKSKFVDIIQTDLVEVLRIRGDGTNQNGIGFFECH